MSGKLSPDINPIKPYEANPETALWSYSWTWSERPSSQSQTSSFCSVLPGTTNLSLGHGKTNCGCRINVQQKSFELDAGTSLWDLTWIAGQAGLRSNGLNGGGSWHRWNWQEVRAEIQRGHPVITLVRMSRLLYATNYRADSDHFIVVMGLVGDKILVNDPALPGLSGAQKVLTREELERAWDATSMPRHGAGFAATAEVREFTFPRMSTPISSDAEFTRAGEIGAGGTPIVVGRPANESATPTVVIPLTNSVRTEALAPSPLAEFSPSKEPISAQAIIIDVSSADTARENPSKVPSKNDKSPVPDRFAAPWMLVAALFSCGWISRLTHPGPCDDR